MILTLAIIKTIITSMIQQYKYNNDNNDINNNDKVVLAITLTKEQY